MVHSPIPDITYLPLESVLLEIVVDMEDLADKEDSVEIQSALGKALLQSGLAC